LEDKIVQSAVAEVLDAIYEADFYGFSYGFRPGRSLMWRERAWIRR
jgi:retron-type reverse transcriptase